MPGQRIVISDVVPQVDCGRWPAKACVGDRVFVAATIVRDGHEPLRAVVRHRKGRARWREEPLRFLGSDRYAGSFPVDAVGRWQFEVEAWVDRHAAWLDEYDRKVAAGQSDLAGELAEGEALFGPGSVEEWREAADALAAAEREGA
jgi:starch synthase (maltosyl-transferring)